MSYRTIEQVENSIATYQKELKELKRRGEWRRFTRRRPQKEDMIWLRLPADEVINPHKASYFSEASRARPSRFRKQEPEKEVQYIILGKAFIGHRNTLFIETSLNQFVPIYPDSLGQGLEYRYVDLRTGKEEE